MTKSEAFDFINDWMERQRKLAGDYVIKNNGELTEFDRGKFDVMGTIQDMLEQLNNKISSSEAQ